MNKKINFWHYARAELALKYLELFRIGLTSARGLVARPRWAKHSGLYAASIHYEQSRADKTAQQESQYQKST